MMGSARAGTSLRLVPLFVIIFISACARPASPATPAASAPAAAPPAAAPITRTLVIASRNEPPSLASKALRFVAAPRGIGSALFNATLDYLDEHGAAQTYLAESLPQLNTDSWRVFP